MASANFSQFFEKKAYEIAYAAVRISSIIKVQSFSERLLDQAFSLLDLSVRGKYADCGDFASAMSYLFRLGSDSGIIHPANAQTMIAELGQFSSAIAEYESISRQPLPVSIEGSFSKMPVVASDKPEIQPEESGSSVKLDEIQNEDYSSVESPMEAREAFRGFEPAFPVPERSKESRESRHSAILEIIRQIGKTPGRQDGCRVKEIEELLHGASERTIRYDLQNLVEQGLVERIGSGGSTHYKPKDATDHGVA